MSGKGSIKRRCHCKGKDGRELGARCPKLANSKHGDYEYRDRLPTSTGYRALRRGGFGTKAEAEQFRDRVHELMALARDDKATRDRVVDLIFKATPRGGHLPATEDVRRRLGIRGGDLDRSQTFGEFFAAWLAGKRRLRPSALKSYTEHGEHYLVPILGHLPIDRLTPEHVADMFELIEEWNAEILAAKAEGRQPVRSEWDTRTRLKYVGPATQRRIFATLRNCLNAACGKRQRGSRLGGPRLIEWNPCDGVELPEETPYQARVWDAEQVGRFLEAAEGDPLEYLFRLILIHGPRRGEAVGARWAGYSHKDATLQVMRPLLQLGGKIVESTPKTRAGVRVLYLDTETNEGIRRLQRDQARNRLRLGAAYQDNDLIFCREDGSPYPPDYVSRRFREIADRAGLPVIRLHEGRHTAATLRLEAGVDEKIVSEQMGHSTITITRNLYQHVRRAMRDKATDAVIALLPERRRSAEAAG